MAENITLYELNNMLSIVVGNAFQKQYKVAAEISELRINGSGHCYMELIEKDEQGNTVAKARANIWASTFRKLQPFFEYSTGISLKAGIKILVTVKVSFDPLYHYSLTVWDIDPAYTVGDMAMRRTQILNRLADEGVIDDNKSLTLSPIPKRIAVISSATAAGYGDFCDQLKKNTKGYVFYPVLFKALMQGEQASESIINALNRIYCNMNLFDCVVIIRGGGATSELNCFDDYNLALNITQFPLPVIVGIGHERDITVLDYVAYKSIKTPTAVAEFLISKISESDDYLNELSGEIADRIKDILNSEKLTLSTIESQLPSLVINKIEREKNGLSQLQSKVLINIRERVGREQIKLATTHTSLIDKFERAIERENNRILNIEKSIELLSPDRILKRGYSISVKDGFAVKSVTELREGDYIKVVFADGEAETEVKNLKNI
ncbi:MAG: exodeoxyribonuclease VII large subunit [Muribaculaceae bacterium]|nr:exodeoxyribonuclease VII large subunit [Muribaculaceae bacterium]